MTELEGLRAMVNDAAHRRYGPLRRRRRLVRRIVPLTLGTGAVAAACALTLMQTAEPEIEAGVPTTTATPSVYTVKVIPEPTPAPITGPPRIVRTRVLEDDRAAELFKAAGGNSKNKLERAWATPGMQGESAHVFLYRRGGQRCLSVADPLTTEPGDRGVGCSPPDVFERFGVSVTVGSNYAAVVPDARRPPIYRHTDGTREPLEPVDGLVALARTQAGSAVALYAPDGKRRTDAFRDLQHGTPKPQNRHECSNGESILVPQGVKLDHDPCTAMVASRANAERMARPHVDPPDRP